MQEEKLMVNVQSLGFQTLEEMKTCLENFAHAGIKISEIGALVKRRAEHNVVVKKMSIPAYDSKAFHTSSLLEKESGELVFQLEDERVLVKLGNASRSVRISDLLDVAIQIQAHQSSTMQARNADLFWNSLFRIHNPEKELK
jgi:hypothetical protein